LLGDASEEGGDARLVGALRRRAQDGADDDVTQGSRFDAGLGERRLEDGREQVDRVGVAEPAAARFGERGAEGGDDDDVVVGDAEALVGGGVAGGGGLLSGGGWGGV
jgi:hypothetical protein